MIRGRPFEPGNKFGRGRPKGSRNRRTLKAQALFDEYQEPVIKKCIAKALEGDPRAMTLCVERILPPQRDIPVRVKMKKLGTRKDVDSAAQQVLEDMGKGKLTPQEAERPHGLLANLRDYRENEEMESRIAAIEQTVREQNSDE
jgi:hypothetical protein